MVIGKKFAWGHLPKTGGEATRAMFDFFPDLIEFADPKDTIEKHTFFKDRKDALEGKLLALNIRRLPAWILSREHHKAKHGLHPDNQPTRMVSPQQMAESSFPDHRLSSFTDERRIEIGRWIRTESLATDFLEFVAGFTDVSEEQEKEVLGLGLVNTIAYDHDVHHWFTDRQLETLYRNNPVWSALEKAVYGETILERLFS
jgi:hypothetical protein